MLNTSNENMSISLPILKKLKPELDEKVQIALSDIFDEVVSLIIKKIFLLEREKYTNEHIHYLLKEEMLFEVMIFMSSLSEKVVNYGINNLNFLELNIEKVHEGYLNNNGLVKIENTANELFIIWDKKYSNWIKKTQKLLDKEQNKEAPKKRTPQTVNINHFITKSFIKDYWSDDKLNINLITKKHFKSKYCSYGNFGKKKNIYSDRIEDYFGLLEGDAKQPLKKLIDFIPINRLEKEAIVGFIIIHYLRNPYSFKAKNEKLLLELPLVNEYINKNELHPKTALRDIHETLFNNNELYGILTENILINKWILLNSEERLFILPDTALYYQRKSKGQIIIFPISPKQCLIILNEQDMRHEATKCIADSKSLSIEQSMIFSKFLIDMSENSILVDKNFLHYQDKILSLNTDIEDILKLLQKFN